MPWPKCVEVDVLLLRKKGRLKIERTLVNPSRKMARSVFANEDLKRHIFSFGYPEHVEFTKSLSEVLKVDSGRFHDRYYEERHDRCIYDYLMDEFTPKELVAWTNYFARCRCCTRHSHDKPYIRKSVVIYTPKIQSTDECDCPCRSLGRNCARVYEIIG